MDRSRSAAAVAGAGFGLSFFFDFRGTHVEQDETGLIPHGQYLVNHATLLTNSVPGSVFEHHLDRSL